MSNELVITLDGGQWMYFNTQEVTADKALQRFNEACDIIQLNTNNINIKSVELRDVEGETIGEIIF